MHGIGFWLQRHAELHPDREALITPERRYTYGDLDAEANRAAHGLLALGIGAGDRIGLLAMNDPRFLALLFGAGKIGAVVVALNYRLTPAEIAYQMGDSGVVALFVGGEQTPMLPAIREATGIERVVALNEPAPDGTVAYSDFAAQPDTAPGPHIGWDAPLLMVYTSGTTGKPKGALLSHANQFWNAMNDIIALRLSADDTVITMLPLVHVGGLGLFTLPMLLLGGKVVLPRKFEPEQSIKLIDDEQVTVVMGVPAVLQMLLASPAWNTADFGSVRFFYNGGDRCPLDVVEAIRARGKAFGGGYGLTETSPTAFMMEPEDFVRGTSQPGFIGKSAFFTEARLVDGKGNNVEQGKPGELLLRGPNVFGGYWNKPDASAEAFSGGWFRTGDLAQQDDHGLMFVVGRSKEMYKSGGLNVYPAEVEATLAQHPAVREVCVIGVPDGQWGEVGRAIVALKDGTRTNADDLIGWCGERLARYKTPRSVVFVDALPRNTLGKIQRGDLRNEYGQ